MIDLIVCGTGAALVITLTFAGVWSAWKLAYGCVGGRSGR